jgi:uncharacterized protein (TIGR02246 family)
MSNGTAEDREQIRDLYVRYAITIDSGQYEQWLDCFTDDGVFESPRFGRHVGRDGLRKFTQIYKESLGGAQVRHVISAVHFDIEGDRATGGCYLTYFHSKIGKTELAAVGEYRDKLRKVGGAWRFESRQVTVDGHG